ncbi:hypothetical protein COU17_03640 [Candidatus Kaiserbacteria bacterium CG10_big_fil_rev_8_21_14_0_10_49_17]|uniref:Uncharacterized protein n=1 Tax=Candidatus Kaiserbacteria bacterium CG10_big_fil_rev_8_21_14_0_10_49_17 TaxID=1974609 RepID=A0A2M6WDJ6_9BACT|nr:MAG: hypothetical protein COU17_03640 [Candidatus Kaiserbacteria bacterium CG10_big_fil_rev_8_21_14_0_10_49_17]
MSTRKIQVIVVLVIATLMIIGGYAAYLFIFSKKTADTPIGGGVISGNGGVFTFDSVEPFLNEDANDPFLALSETPRLRQISATPVAGATVFSRGDDIVYRYVERATGHIFETTSESFAQTRVSNTTIPQVYNAVFVENGNGVIMQYLSEDEVIRTLYAEIIFDAESGGGSIASTFLPDNILSITASPSGNKIFYLLRDTAVGSVGYVSDPDGSNPAVVFDSPLKEWVAMWTAEERITLATKPANGMPGVSFLVEKDQDLSGYLFSGIPGLSTLVDRTGENILFSTSSGEDVSLYVISPFLEETTALPFGTFPMEKCVWGNDLFICAVPVSGALGVYPDEWYQGTETFRDDLYLVDVETSTMVHLANLENLGVSLDINALWIDETQQYLLLSNKSDGTLWAFRLLEQVKESTATTTPAIE